MERWKKDKELGQVDTTTRTRLFNEVEIDVSLVGMFCILAVGYCPPSTVGNSHLLHGPSHELLFVK